jgi:NADPH:quinone reductase-like Zn-dependent oxidoreductase
MNGYRYIIHRSASQGRHRCAKVFYTFIAVLGLTLAGLSGAAMTYQEERMSAIRIHGFGGREVLQLEPAARPAPSEGELLVRVHAAGVNPVDWKIRKSGARGWLDVKLPYTPGFDVSGVVEQVGAGVTRFRPGDPVFAFIDLARGGAYAEFAIVREDEAAAKPQRISHVEAAAMPLVALTAWQALFETADLQPGQTVLIHAGAGGVGSVAVQLAKWKGAKVIATASRDNHDFLRGIGADEVIDYRSQKFDELVKNVDVVLDSVGGKTHVDSYKVLRRGGILVSIVGETLPQQAEEIGVRSTAILVHPAADQLAQIAKLIDDGRVKPVVSHVFPLSDVARAHEQSETGRTRGKIVLRVVDE